MRTLRPSNEAGRERARIGGAFAASLVLHLLAVLVFPHATLDAPPAPPPPLTARLAPPPEPRDAAPAEAPPPVVKNTLDVPKQQPLEDPIKPQPRRRITDQPEPQPPKPVPLPPKPPPEARTPVPEKPAPAPPPPKPVEPPAAPPPLPPTASRDEAVGRPLDLSIPSDPRTRTAERLSPQELNETLTRLSETMLYPSEALRRGLEGEVVILVELGPEGRINNAAIASGSGHALLDDAAVRAVRKLGSLGPSTANRTILLPVRFRIL
jgi:protein TonB